MSNLHISTFICKLQQRTITKTGYENSEKITKFQTIFSLVSTRLDYNNLRLTLFGFRSRNKR